MNTDIVKQINHLQAEKAELKSALKETELNEESEYDAEEIKKEIASINAEIIDLSSKLLN